MENIDEWRRTAEKIIDQYEPKIVEIINTLPSPDFIIGDDYLQRWWLAKNINTHDSSRLGELRSHTTRVDDYSCYLHRVTGSDDDRAFHDHPWCNASLIISGKYMEHTPHGSFLRCSGDRVYRSGTALHRLEVIEGPVWSLFVAGKKYREWGFDCPNGWVHWKDFTGYHETGNSRYVGRGCGEP